MKKYGLVLIVALIMCAGFLSFSESASADHSAVRVSSSEMNPKTSVYYQTWVVAPTVTVSAHKMDDFGRWVRVTSFTTEGRGYLSGHIGGFSPGDYVRIGVHDGYHYNYGYHQLPR